MSEPSARQILVELLERWFVKNVGTAPAVVEVIRDEPHILQRPCTAPTGRAHSDGKSSSARQSSTHEEHRHDDARCASRRSVLGTE